jgi:hypothetical protein
MQYLYVAVLLLLLSLSLRLYEPFYNPEEPISRPENFPDHSGHRAFMEIESILYALIQTPSMTVEEKAYLEDFLNLVQTIPETSPPSYLLSREGNSTVQNLEYVKRVLLKEFSTLTVTNAAFVPVKNAIYYLTWLLKNIFD